MITKELFCSIVDNIKRQEELDKKMEDVLAERTKSYIIFDSENLYLKSLLDLLKVIFNDNDDTIGWWLYEDVDKIIYMPNGEERDISTTEVLYDYLILNKE